MIRVVHRVDAACRRRQACIYVRWRRRHRVTRMRGRRMNLRWGLLRCRLGRRWRLLLLLLLLVLLLGLIRVRWRLPLAGVAHWGSRRDLGA